MQKFVEEIEENFIEQLWKKFCKKLWENLGINMEKVCGKL